MILPPLKDDETFRHRKVWDEDWSVYAVELTLTKGSLRHSQRVTFEEAYYGRADVLRNKIENMLVELRALAGDDK